MKKHVLCFKDMLSDIIHLHHKLFHETNNLPGNLQNPFTLPVLYLYFAHDINHKCYIFYNTYVSPSDLPKSGSET